MNKLRRYCEEESRINKNLEQIRQEMGGKIQALEKREASASQLIAMLRNEVSTLNESGSLQRNRVIEIEAQNLSLSDQIEHLERYVEKLENDKTALTQRVQELSEELNRSAQKTIETGNKVRKEGEIQVEREVNFRKAIEEKLNEIESREKDLEIQLLDKSDLAEGLQVTINKFERFNQDLKNKNQDIEEELKNTKLRNKELQKSLEKSRRNFEERISKIWRLLMFKVESLRSEVSTIRTNSKSELELHHHSSQEAIRQLINHFQGKLSFDKLRLQEDKRRELQDIKDEYEERVKSLEIDHQQEIDHEKSNAQRLIDGYIKENKALMSIVEEVKRDSQEVMLRIEKGNLENLDYRNKLDTIEGENDWLKRVNAKKDEEFSALQQFVKGELRRIKEESNQITKEVTLQIRAKNKQDVGVLIQAIDELKSSNVRRLKHFESELMNYEVIHERELIEAAENFQREIYALKDDLRQAEEELVRKEEEKRSLKADYDKICERYKELHQDNEEMLAKFEEKLANFKEMMRTDNENYLEKRNQANTEIEKLRLHSKDLTKELKEKNYQIEELNLRVKYYKEDLTKYKGLLDQRSSGAERSFGEIDKLSPSFGLTDPDGFDFILKRPIGTKNSYKSVSIKNPDNRSTLVQEEQRHHSTSIMPKKNGYGEK